MWEWCPAHILNLSIKDALGMSNDPSKSKNPGVRVLNGWIALGLLARSPPRPLIFGRARRASDDC